MSGTNLHLHHCWEEEEEELEVSESKDSPSVDSEQRASCASFLEKAKKEDE